MQRIVNIKNAIARISGLFLFFFQASPFASPDSVLSSPNWVSINSTGGNKYKAVKALAFKNGMLYAGGDFDSIGSVRQRGLARFDGNAWQPLGGGISGYPPAVKAFAFDSAGHLVAGGTFDSIGTVKTPNIARWDGAKWNALGTGVPEGVRTITVDIQNHVFASGDTYQENYSVRAWDVMLAVSEWNDSAWIDYKLWNLGRCCTGNFCSCPYNGMGINAIVSDYYKGIYYGGDFNQMPPSTKIVFAWAMTVDDSGSIYIAGKMETDMYSDTIDCLRKITWTPAGPQSINFSLREITTQGLYKISTLAVDKKGHLFAGASFTVNGFPGLKNNILVYDGASARPLVPGVNGPIYALALDENSGRLYVGGSFDSVGGCYSPMVAAVDLYKPAAILSDNRPVLSEHIEYHVKNSTLIISNARSGDRILLYSFSGRCIRQAEAPSTVNLARIARQTLLVVVNRRNKVLAKGLVQWQ